MSENGLISGERRIGAGAVDDEARRLAGWLADQGIGENDVVALLMWNDFPYFSLPRACALLGAYLVPLNWHLTRPELDYILGDCGARVLIGHDVLLAHAGFANGPGLTVLAKPTPGEIAAAYPRQCAGPDAHPRPGAFLDWDAALASVLPRAGDPLPGARGGVFYTSGTTGNPKGVVRDPMPDDVARQIRGRTLAGFGLDIAAERAVALAPGPLYHSAPNAHAINAWNLGMDLVLMPRFDAAQALDLIAGHRVSHAHMVPTMFSRLLELPPDRRTGFDPAPLRAVCHGAAPCPAEVKRRMIDWWGPVIHEYYAGTETGVIAGSTSRDWLSHPGSVGRALGEVEVRVIDAEGRACPAGKTGRLICRSLSTTRFSYRGHPDAHVVEGWPGYVALGDIGHVDDDGFIHLTDRSSEIVISGGVNIYPAEIEKVLSVLPGVADCVVFGLPEPQLGEALVGLVRAAPGTAPQETELLDALRPHLAAYKLPRRILMVEELPREDSGKIRKRSLRAQYVNLFAKGARP